MFFRAAGAARGRSSFRKGFRLDPAAIDEDGGARLRLRDVALWRHTLRVSQTLKPIVDPRPIVIRRDRLYLRPGFSRIGKLAAGWGQGFPKPFFPCVFRAKCYD